MTVYQHDNHGLLIQQLFKADRSTASANWLRAIRDRKQPGTSRASGLGTASESINGVS
ncbi:MULTISPECIES: hypothetical protein [Streptosporangium]|uniref:PH domain-containing protein n=1 Tax=Streptosporangium brasiliense TaxID=47480 RepID=A0ABT9RIE6_9ACTN|nr:hypothetical protein [Streptosporangium brasiliense]MDP9869069.1 hypothetical protein [Streptosporangium brasiliense]